MFSHSSRTPRFSRTRPGSYWPPSGNAATSATGWESWSDRLRLTTPMSQLRTLVQRTFAVASKYKIAVGLHIDDSKFWMNRRDLWVDHANVEWLDWSGTPNTGQYLDWGGGPWKLAPQACLNSPAMVKEARRVAGSVIGPAIAEGLANLRSTGDEALFAGVIVGWETQLGRDFDTGRDLGYCALTNLGFSANSPPTDIDGGARIRGSKLDRNLVKQSRRRRRAKRQNLLAYRICS